MDLSTSYLGLRLQNPFIAGASPMAAHLDTVRRLEDAGCAAIVMHSLFEEQITLASTGRIRHKDPLDAQFAGALAQFPPMSEYQLGPDEYLEQVRRIRQSVAIPVIASLNGTTRENWLEFALRLQQAGAQGLELNMYEVVTDPRTPGIAIEAKLRDAVSAVARLVDLPIAAKLSPFFASVANVAVQLDAAGADGLVLFNRFYQPDIDIRTITARPTLELSHSPELLLRLRWLAVLHGRVAASLAATGGVETPGDAIKALLAGAHAVQMVSAILRHGPAYFTTMREGLASWMAWHHFATIDDVRGRVSLQHVEDPDTFERANYIRSLHTWGV